MATLTGNTIASTYDGLIKTKDDTNISAHTAGSAQQLTDGLNNSSSFFLGMDRCGVNTPTPGSVLTVKDGTSNNESNDEQDILQLSHSYIPTDGSTSGLLTLKFAGKKSIAGVPTGEEWCYIKAGQDDDFFAAGGADHSTCEGNMQFWTNGGTAGSTEKMRITSAGNVGIGTSTPGNELEVAAEHPQIEISCWSTAPGNEGVLLFKKNKQDTIEGALVATENDEDLGLIKWTGVNSGEASDTAALILCEQDAASDTHISGRLSFYTSKSDGSTSARMTIKSDGKVGIGTTTPVSTLSVAGIISIGEDTQVTIATGAITVTQSYHDVDTEGDASSDVLNTINGGVLGAILVLTCESTSRTVVVHDISDGGGNIVLAGGSNFSMTDSSDTLMLMYNGSNWLQLGQNNN